MKPMNPEMPRVLNSLLRRALFGSGDDCEFSALNVSWATLMSEATKQTVLPLALEAALSLPDGLQPPESALEPWRDMVIQQVVNNERLMAEQEALLGQFDNAGIPCVILKGSSAACAYPRPELRVLGDIDLLVDRAMVTRAAALLQSLGYVQVKVSEAFHLGFAGPLAFVELHFEATKYPDGPRGAYLERMMADVVRLTRRQQMNGYHFPGLTLQRQAISLLIHMQYHMKGFGIGLRHLCDFAMFVYSVTPETWQADIAPVLREGGLLRFAEALVKACVMYLGLPESSVPWCAAADESLARDLYADFVDSGNFGRKQPNLRATSVLSADKTGTGAKGGMLRTAIRNINHYARLHYPLAGRLPLTLPYYWVFIPVRHLILSKRRHEHPHVGSTLAVARRRKKLFDRL